MSRALDLRLQPAADAKTGATFETYVYAIRERWLSEMAENVTLGFRAGLCSFTSELTPDEARVLANQLLQVADVADEQRAARIAEDELQASFDEICEDMRNAEELGGTGCWYSHPWIHYVPAAQLAAKTKELTEAGVKTFMVLVEPTHEEVKA